MALTMCLCACGEAADRRSRYRGDHFRLLVCARRKFRESRRYAARRGFVFRLGLEDVLKLVRDAWPRSDTLALRRRNRRRGFEVDNVELGPQRGGRRRRDTLARLRRRLQRLAQRHGVRTLLQVEDLLRLHAKQDGRCALSGRRLQTHARLGSPDALALIRLDPRKPWSPTNVQLVTACVRHAVERWGVPAVLGLAHDVVAKGGAGKASPARRATGGDGRG